MIPSYLCPLSTFSGVLFRLYVKLVFGFMLNLFFYHALSELKSIRISILLQWNEEELRWC